MHAHIAVQHDNLSIVFDMKRPSPERRAFYLALRSSFDVMSSVYYNEITSLLSRGILWHTKKEYYLF